MVIFQSQVINFDGEQENDTDSIHVRLPQQCTSKCEQLAFISCRLKGEVASNPPLQPISPSLCEPQKCFLHFSYLQVKCKKKTNPKLCFTEPRKKEKDELFKNIKCKYSLAPSPQHWLLLQN